MRRARRRAALAVLGVLVPGVVIGVVLAAALHAAGLQVSTWYCATLAIGAFALLALAKVLIADVETPLRPAAGPVPAPERPADVLVPLERRVAAALRERRLFVTGLQPLLYDLARERLRVHRTLDLDQAMRHDPDLARLTLGDDLWQWMTTRTVDGPPPTQRQLQALIEAVSRL